ncbi:MAG: carboxypeptidase regulatory-like domain-containing protein [Hyphomicrobiales bacterium]|nr:carboxypeptidase regulatory-like domain-containing protein [Hyphomicrobiales bacterium]
MKQFILLSFLTLSLAACQSVSTPSPDVTTAFDPQQAAFILHKGKGTIKGIAFITDDHGKAHRHGGETVRLIPESAYAEARFSDLYAGKKFIAVQNYPKGVTMDPRYGKYMRLTKTMPNGKFTFTDVPPGHYFVATQVLWRGHDGGGERGGAIYDTVHVTGQEHAPIEVIVSGT